MFELTKFERVCFVCLQRNEKMTSVFQTLDGATTLIELINDCIDYKLKHFEGFPQQICTDCKQLALNAYKFKRKCQEAIMQLVGKPILKRGFQNAETQTESNFAACHTEVDSLSLNAITEFSDRESPKQLKTDINEELLSLPVIEEVDLKMLPEKSFTHIDDDERDEDLLVYITQFDGLSDDEDDEPLSRLQQTDKLQSPMSEIAVVCEFKETNLKGIETVANSSQIESITRKKTDGANEKTDNKKRKKTNKSAQLHQCNICEKKFTSTYLQRHKLMHAKKRFHCKECAQNFPTKEELRIHVKTEGHDKRLLCPECGLRCRTSNILMVHMRRHKGEKPFKCKFCSKGFPRSDDLRLHEKYHTGEKSHFCGTCGKGFQRKYNLKIHLRVHTGEKPYKCPNCPQAFAQANDLKAHIRRHTGERFRCEICDAAFLQGYQIRQHKLSEHGIKDEPPTQRVAKFTSVEAQKQQILQNMNKECL